MPIDPFIVLGRNLKYFRKMIGDIIVSYTIFKNIKFVRISLKNIKVK